MAAKNDPRFIEIHVITSLIELTHAEPQPEVAAYVFSSDGRLFASEKVKDGEKVSLRIPAPSSRDRLRVLVGPASEEKSANYDDLIRRGGQQQFLLVNPKDTVNELNFHVIPDIWQCWIYKPCFVRGKLLKRVTIGGTKVEFPVCSATVDVYEVDPLHILIPRLPDEVVDRLRDIIDRPWPMPPEFKLPPNPDPNPLPGPGPEPEPFERRRMLTASGAATEASQALEQVANATDLKYIARVGSRLQFQQALIDNAFIIRPLLCRLSPGLFTKQKVATVTTDECGKFQTMFFRGCTDTDIPDLYFKGHQRLSGFFDVTIYEPKPVSCYTHWDYACGTEVTLYTSHPLAHTCSPCPPVIPPGNAVNWVAFLAIGGRALSHIHGTAPDLQETKECEESEFDDKTGLTDECRPWGGMLRPRIEFSNTLQALGVKYYRLSWCKVQDTGLDGPYLPLNSAVTHYYRHDVNTPTGLVPAWSPYKLGPYEVDDGMGHKVPDLFEIPYPSVAPEGVWDVPPDINEIVEHLGNAKFPTQSLAPGMTYDDNGNTVGPDNSGKYRLKLDLFDVNGQQVNVATLGIKYVVPDVPELTGTITTSPAEPLGLVDGNSMIITLHVDNNHCFAGIDAPTIGSAAADPCCGVLGYNEGDSVTMTCKAKHPHGFAIYHFSVVRGGTSILTLPMDPVGDGSISITHPVSNLLNDNLPDGCALDGCPVAGFSENLRVDSTATDGWTSELGYDARAVRAFVLAKPTSS